MKRLQSPYRFAVPPITPATGNLTAIWIDPTMEVAFVWKKDMRFYVDPLHDSTRAVAIEGWKLKAAAGEGQLVAVCGQTGIGHERSGDDPSALTFIDKGLSLQFIFPSHSLEELEQFAELIIYE